ncbi:hypothetical protein GSI_11601 [Ganoderma sinense ZZ0214-1]|uniref:F-box domain-containing protein n=1 Tax=Ganoderma sinense ZZ0214-1 TaxID=1077348 RepID=A0A2G8RX04_9APHY|nr:hypothetical protein GSI_11601 [Ganoderma sinense ZZ0214-1]
MSGCQFPSPVLSVQLERSTSSALKAQPSISCLGTFASSSFVVSPQDAHTVAAFFRMDTRPRLPHDVLLNVASFADRKSILALLTTTRSLHSDGGKYVVQDPVTLDGNQDIVSFIYFMRPYKHKRWRHLRFLHLRDAPISPGVAKALAKAIPRASHLSYLEFEDAEKTLGAHPDLPLAFAALRAVKDIVIDHGYHHTCRMLEAMKWPLESAELKHSDHEFDRDCRHRIHPAALLKNSQATLKTLECSLWSDFDDVLDTYPVYPHLESLHVEIWCPSVAHWAVSYPNLKRLHVNTLDDLFMKEANEDQLDRYAAIRSHNLEEHMAQEQQWVELDEFDGHTALDLYLLGLPCRVRAVSFALCPSSLRFFAPAMETARPTALTVFITSELFSQPVPTYLEDPGLVDVKALGIDVQVWAGGTAGDVDVTHVDRFLEHVLRLLQQASAQRFSLCLEVERLDDPPLSDYDTDDQDERRLRPPAPPRAVSPIETWINGTDLGALVRRFHDEVPSLDWVQFSVKAPFISCRKEAESSGRLAPEEQLLDTSLPVP